MLMEWWLPRHFVQTSPSRWFGVNLHATWTQLSRTPLVDLYDPASKELRQTPCEAAERRKRDRYEHTAEYAHGLFYTMAFDVTGRMGNQGYVTTFNSIASTGTASIRFNTPISWQALDCIGSFETDLRKSILSTKSVST